VKSPRIFSGSRVKHTPLSAALPPFSLPMWNAELPSFVMEIRAPHRPLNAP